MKRCLGILCLFLSVLWSVSAGVAHADFYVVPASRGVGTPISAVPYTISGSGHYYLTKSLSYTGMAGNAITVDADNVTLDLMGFSLIGPGKAVGTASGVYMYGRENVTVRNGTVRDFGAYGITDGSQQIGSTDHTFMNVHVLNNGNSGIEVYGSNHHVIRCKAVNNGRHGIYALTGSIVKESICNNNGIDGIHAGPGATVSGNTSRYNGSNGIYAREASTIIQNTVRNNTQSGIAAGNYCTVVNNTSNGNTLSGVYAESYVTATGNTIVDNNANNLEHHAGLRVSWGSIIKGNTLSQNTRYNIRVWGSDNAVEENLVTQSAAGIYFVSNGNFYANNRASGNTTNYFNTAGQTNGGGNYSF